MLAVVDPKVSERQIAADLGMAPGSGEGSWHRVADANQAASGADALLLLTEQPGLDPLVSLLTLPVRPMPEIPGATDQILRPRPDLIDTVLTILGKRFPQLTREEIMALINLPTDHLRDTRFGRELIEEGRLEGRQEGEARGCRVGEAVVTLRQLNRRCGPLSEATTARIQALPLAQLESLADALLDFSGPADLATWLAQHV